MTAPFKLHSTARFESQAILLPRPVSRQLEQKLRFLETNPQHPSLRTHPVKHAKGDYGGKIFEAYVNDKYRLTWEYGPSKGDITLRNVDNHDDCLKHP